MGIMGRRIVAVRAYVAEGGSADYHDQSQKHWIVKQIATPMSVYPEYKATRTSFGITTGGYPAAWLVANHLDRFIVGQPVENIEQMWDQMYKGSLYYGRKGLVMNAISAIYAMLGGKVRKELSFYATGPRPDLAKEMRSRVGNEFMLMWGGAAA